MLVLYDTVCLFLLSVSPCKAELSNEIVLKSFVSVFIFFLDSLSAFVLPEYWERDDGLEEMSGNDGNELADGGVHGNGILGNHDNIEGWIPESDGGNRPSDGAREGM